MTTYFFHLRDGVDLLLDPDGRRLPSLDAVAAAAMREARALISAEAMTGKISLIPHIDVEDQDGTVVHSLAFEDAVEIERPQLAAAE